MNRTKQKHLIIRPYLEEILKQEFTFNKMKPSLTAPNSWEDLKAYQNKKVIPVYSAFCDKSIYEDSNTNILMRFLHDLTHLKYNLSFSTQDELKTAKIHYEQLAKVKAPKLIQQLVYLDFKAQIKYYNKYKKYVNEQKSFVWECYYQGVEKILNTDKLW